MSRFHLLTSCLTITVAILLTGLENSATAQVKSFKISGGGVADYLPLPGIPPAFHFAVGNATHLGKHYGEGKFRTDTFNADNGSGTFSSSEPFVFTAADGSDLAFHYGRVDFGADGPGIFQLFPAGGNKVFAVFVAEFKPVAALCTGRFKNVVDGSFVMTAMTEAFVPGDLSIGYTWGGKGTIEFNKGK